MCSDSISNDNLKQAESLLTTFVTEFEGLYGETNMVSNIHLLSHLAKCVKMNGPLFCFSNYSFEDFIGHLVSRIHGQIDVLEQISQRYLLEKVFLKNIEKSVIAKKFYEQIKSDKHFSVAQKIQGVTVIGRSVKILNDEEKMFVNNYFSTEDVFIDEYHAVLIHRDFYDCFNDNSTDDSFVYNLKDNCFCEVKCIFSYQNKVYFFLNEKYKRSDKWNDICKAMQPLEIIYNFNQSIINVVDIGPKYALIKYDNSIVCSKFPNKIERD